jgi:hypothetical protein
VLPFGPRQRGPMRWLLLLLLGCVVTSAAACGAKTGLVLPGHGGSGGGTSGGAGAPVGPLAVTCTSAMQAGAPTPTRGYCPTRANQAPFAGPRSPKVAWTAKPFAITDPESFFPAQVVVDASGRSYVLVDASPINYAGGPNRLSAVEAEGTVAWTQSFPQPVSSPSLGVDGELVLLGTDILVLSRDGTVSRDLPLGVVVDSGLPQTPTVYPDLALGSDGSFFVALAGSLPDASSLERVTQLGEVVWQYPWQQGDPLASPFVLTPTDAVVDLSTGELLELGADGDTLWQAGVGSSQGASDPQGNVYIVDVPTGTNPVLQVVGAAGSSVRTLSLGLTNVTVDASQLAVAGDGTAVVLVANEVTSPGNTQSHVVVTAISASGGVRWSTPFDVTLPFDPAERNAHYGVFVDAQGTVVVTAGNVQGLDLATGAVEWTLDAPVVQSCLRPVVLGPGGSLVGTQCDGTVFLARDP